MGSLSTAIDFICLWTEENTLLSRLILLGLRHRVSGSTLIANCRVNCKGAVYVTTRLIEFNCLPGVFSSRRNRLVFIDLSRSCCLGLLLILLRVDLDISFNMILTEPQWQIEFKWIVLATLRFLESRGIRCRSPGSAISGPSRVWRVVVVWGPVGGRCGCGWEEARLGPCLVRRCVHLVFDVSWLPDWVSQLDYEVIIQMVFIWRLRLFSNSGSDYLTFTPICSSWICRSCWDCWRRCLLETVIPFIFDCLCVSSCFWNFWATFTLFRTLRGPNLNCFSFRWFLLIYLHGLVEFLLDHFCSCWRFHIFESNWCWLLRGSLGVQPFTFFVVVALMCWESFSHVVVSLVFLVDQMVSGRDVVVSVSF